MKARASRQACTVAYPGVSQGQNGGATPAPLRWCSDRGGPKVAPISAREPPGSPRSRKFEAYNNSARVRERIDRRRKKGYVVTVTIKILISYTDVRCPEGRCEIHLDP